jgi:membrane protease YdiL (CAAX protease family)
MVGPLLVLFCFFVVFPAEISSGTPDYWHWHIVVLTGIFVPMFNYNLLGGPLFEEFGWRGFLQSRMQQILPPWIAALLVGAMWAAWHLPLFLVQGWSSASPFVFLLIMLGLSLVMAFAFNWSNEAVLVAILMHSAFNASPRFLEGYLNGTRTRDHPSGELLIAVSFLFVGGVLSVATRGCLAHSFQPSQSGDDPGLNFTAVQR